MYNPTSEIKITESKRTNPTSPPLCSHIVAMNVVLPVYIIYAPVHLYGHLAWYRYSHVTNISVPTTLSSWSLSYFSVVPSSQNPGLSAYSSRVRNSDSGRSQTNSQWQGDLRNQQQTEGRHRQPSRNLLKQREDQAEQERVQPKPNPTKSYIHWTTKYCILSKSSKNWS